MFLKWVYFSWISFLWLMTIVMILGNLLVIISVVIDKSLKSPRYHLLSSLAITDLIVGLLVMPVWLTVNRQPGDWYYGRISCQIFVSTYFLVAHASLNHLLVIALDRYWSIIDINYIYKSTKRRVRVMIGFCWGWAALSPVAGNMIIDFEDLDKRLEQHQCFAQIIPKYAFIGALTHVLLYYAIVVVIIGLYYRIFKIAREVQKRGKHIEINVISKPAQDANKDTQMEVEVEYQVEYQVDKMRESNKKERCDKKAVCLQEKERDVRKGFNVKQVERKRKIQRTEGKAALTLGIITATFIVCCSPFYVIFTYFELRAYLSSARSDFEQTVYNNVYLLNLLNSACNPIIYTIFTLNLREAFKRTLAKVTLCGWASKETPGHSRDRSQGFWASVMSSARSRFGSHFSRSTSSIQSTTTTTPTPRPSQPEVTPV